MKHKINWPEDRDYKWWAMDANGKAWFCIKEPECGITNWQTSTLDDWKNDETFKNTKNLNWKESLVCRDDCAEAGTISEQPTMRDQFAMAALSGMLGHPKCAVSEPEKDAKWAYKYADAMMEARYD